MDKKEIVLLTHVLSAEDLYNFILEGRITFDELKTTGRLSLDKQNTIKDFLKVQDRFKVVESTVSKNMIVDLSIDIEFNNFKYENAFDIISEIEIRLGKSNIKFKQIMEGSTILSIELDYDDALKLISLINQGKFKDLGILNARVKQFTESPFKGKYKSNFHQNLSQDFKEEITQIKLLCETDLSKALLITKEKLVETSEKFNQLLIITNRFYRWRQMTIRTGTYTLNENERVFSDIIYSLLMLLDSLEIEDFDLSEE